MGNTFKSFANNDITTTRTLLHEALPITGSIVSGTYVNDGNIKNYSHGLFQSVYDYPYLSSSANKIFDLTFGYAGNSNLSGGANAQNARKINMYNQMAQVLAGHDATGSILNFDEDGDIIAGGTKIKECIFIPISRLLVKDEIKKGSFSMELGVAQSWNVPFTSILYISDSGAQNEFRVNSPAGEYGILSASSGSSSGYSGSNTGLCGLIYYQAGVIVLTGSVFLSTAQNGGKLGQNATINSNGDSIIAALTGSNISGCADSFRRRLRNISFNNTTELNSSIYHCRINHNEFNYSSSPTYLSSSKIVVKNSTLDQPVSYITTVGLYSSDNELLAAAKLSEALKKTPENEINLRIRLDF